MQLDSHHNINRESIEETGTCATTTAAAATTTTIYASGEQPLRRSANCVPHLSSDPPGAAIASFHSIANGGNNINLNNPQTCNNNNMVYLDTSITSAEQQRLADPAVAIASTSTTTTSNCIASQSYSTSVGCAAGAASAHQRAARAILSATTTTLSSDGQPMSGQKSNQSQQLSALRQQDRWRNPNPNHKQQHNLPEHEQVSSRTSQVLPSELAYLFECPICFDYAVPPIYQCQNGHLVCQQCSSKITHCPTCRVAITEPSIRNLQLDRLANTFEFPCKYNFNGCNWKSYWFDKREHELNCEYISYSCPCPGSSCKWTGLLSQVMQHLSEHHKSITTLSGEDIVFLATDINLKGAVDWVMIQSCFNHHFLLVLEKQETKTGQQQFFAIVQLIGSQKDAARFRYKLELSSDVVGNMKRLQWEATPKSIMDGIQSAISTHDCLVFDARMAQHFLSPLQKDRDNSNPNDGQGENLGINVTIDCIQAPSQLNVSN